jgi:hypothetical protein
MELVWVENKQSKAKQTKEKKANGKNQRNKG